MTTVVTTGGSTGTHTKMATKAKASPTKKGRFAKPFKVTGPETRLGPNPKPYASDVRNNITTIDPHHHTVEKDLDIATHIGAEVVGEMAAEANPDVHKKKKKEKSKGFFGSIKSAFSSLKTTVSKVVSTVTNYWKKSKPIQKMVKGVQTIVKNVKKLLGKSSESGAQHLNVVGNIVGLKDVPKDFQNAHKARKKGQWPKMFQMVFSGIKKVVDATKAILVGKVFFKATPFFKVLGRAFGAVSMGFTSLIDSIDLGLSARKTHKLRKIKDKVSDPKVKKMVDHLLKKKRSLLTTQSVQVVADGLLMSGIILGATPVGWGLIIAGTGLMLGNLIYKGAKWFGRKFQTAALINGAKNRKTAGAKFKGFFQDLWTTATTSKSKLSRIAVREKGLNPADIPTYQNQYWAHGLRSLIANNIDTEGNITNPDVERLTKQLGIKGKSFLKRSKKKRLTYLEKKWVAG